MRGAPGGVQTGHTHPIVLILARGSCPCDERRGFRGEERTGAGLGTGRRHGIRTHGERGEGKEEGVTGMTKDTWASERASVRTSGR